MKLRLLVAIMKSFKLKFSSDSCRLRSATLELHFLANFWRDFHRIDAIYDILSMCTADSSVLEGEFCTIVPYASKNFLQMQTERECLRTKINTQQRVV